MSADPAASSRGALPAVRLVRGALGVIGLAAITRQLTIVVDLPGTPVVSYLSFFTIQSNLIASVMLMMGAALPRVTPARDRLRGASVLFILITFVVYVVTLAVTTEGLGITIPWVNGVVHELLPLALVVDWLVVPPAHRIERRHALRWLAFPVAYFLYSQLRGFAIGWYPYAFLDPGKSRGYSGVLATGLGMLAAMAAVALAVAATGNRRRPPESGTAPG